MSIVSVLPIVLACSRDRVKSTNASAVLAGLCSEIETAAATIPIGNGSDEDEHEHGQANDGDDNDDDDDDQGFDDRDDDDDQQDDDGDDDGDDEGDDDGDGDGQSCRPPAAPQRLKRLASEFLPTRTRAARQILAHGPRFSDTVLLSASTISGDSRDRKPQQWLARVVLERFDSCPRQISSAAIANAALALGKISENPQNVHGHRFGRRGASEDDDDEVAQGEPATTPEYVYWTLSAAACADELNVRHAGVRALGQLRDERARPLLEAIAAAPSTGDDVQDALLVVNVNRSLTTIFPTNSVSPEIVSEAKAGLYVLRDALADAEVAP